MKEQLLNKAEKHIVAKVGIAHGDQFLHLKHCIEKVFATEASRNTVCGKGLKISNPLEF